MPHKLCVLAILSVVAMLILAGCGESARSDNNGQGSSSQSDSSVSASHDTPEKNISESSSNDTVAPIESSASQPQHASSSNAAASSMSGSVPEPSSMPPGSTPPAEQDDTSKSEAIIIEPSLETVYFIIESFTPKASDILADINEAFLVAYLHNDSSVTLAVDSMYVVEHFDGQEWVVLPFGSGRNKINPIHEPGMINVGTSGRTPVLWSYEPDPAPGQYRVKRTVWEWFDRAGAVPAFDLFLEFEIV